MSLALGLVALSLVTAAGPEKLKEDRLLLCRPQVVGNPTGLPVNALLTAAKDFGKVFIDYGAPCEQNEESTGAARRAGVRFAIRPTVEGRVGQSHFVLTLNDAATDKATASREVDVPSGRDPVEPLKGALAELSHSSPQSTPSNKVVHNEAWYVVAAGAAVMAVGTGLAVAAGSAANDRDKATTSTKYINSDASWRKYKTMSGVSLGVGAAAVAAGLTWRFAF